MYIENGNTLIVKSGIDYFEKERSGKKPNTWRDLDDIYDDGIETDVLESAVYIKVISVSNPLCSFTRRITDVSYWNEIAIISWEHSNGTN